MKQITNREPRVSQPPRRTVSFHRHPSDGKAFLKRREEGFQKRTASQKVRDQNGIKEESPGQEPFQLTSLALPTSVISEDIGKADDKIKGVDRQVPIPFDAEKEIRVHKTSFKKEVETHNFQTTSLKKHFTIPFISEQMKFSMSKSNSLPSTLKVFSQLQGSSPVLESPSKYARRQKSSSLSPQNEGIVKPFSCAKTELRDFCKKDQLKEALLSEGNSPNSTCSRSSMSSTSTGSTDEFIVKQANADATIFGESLILR